MNPTQRTTFEQAIRQTLSIVKRESPITVSAIADLCGIDPRAVSRVIDFLVNLQDEFAKTTVKILEGKWGKVVWTADRIDKTLLPKEIRAWYINKRFFEKLDKATPSFEEIQSMFEERKRTPVEQVVRRVFGVLEVEDDMTIAELSRRVRANRKTVDRALNIILEFQDEIAAGRLTRKELVIWRRRTPIYELDDTTIMYQLKRWHFPDEVDKISDDQERELLQIA